MRQEELITPEEQRRRHGAELLRGSLGRGRMVNVRTTMPGTSWAPVKARRADEKARKRPFSDAWHLLRCV
jgi:hypothetical protein